MTQCFLTDFCSFVHSVGNLLYNSEVLLLEYFHYLLLHYSSEVNILTLLHLSDNCGYLEDLV